MITSTNAVVVSKLAGRERRVYEVMAKPYDPDLIVAAAKEAAGARFGRTRLGADTFGGR